jgi:hypothetical protein
MKKAGDLLTAFFDEQLPKTARTYSGLFDTWRSIAGERIAAHSRVAEMKQNILLVEADHPGWIQILQTRKTELLSAVRRRFPSLSVSGSSFRLSRPPGNPAAGSGGAAAEEPEPAAKDTGETSAGDPYGGIQDEQFKETLKRLEQSILGQR